jgi:type III secretion system FlhB-like substrate exporter
MIRDTETRDEEMIRRLQEAQVLGTAAKHIAEGLERYSRLGVEIPDALWEMHARILARLTDVAAPAR